MTQETKFGCRTAESRRIIAARNALQRHYVNLTNQFKSVSLSFLRRLFVSHSGKTEVWAEEQTNTSEIVPLWMVNHGARVSHSSTHKPLSSRVAGRKSHKSAVCTKDPSRNKETPTIPAIRSPLTLTLDGAPEFPCRCSKVVDYVNDWHKGRRRREANRMWTNR